MKFRSDFVTNSSSSSFICIFKNKADFEEQMKVVAKNYGGYFRVIYLDILNHRINRTTALKYLKEYYEGMAEFDLYWANSDNSYWSELLEKKGIKSWDIKKLPEFNEAIKEYVQKKMEKAERELPKRGMISCMEYEDDTDMGCVLEHEIMPYMPFVFERLNHH